MKRSVAIILTLVAVVLCGCPGLSFCATAAYSFAIPPIDLLRSLDQIGISQQTMQQLTGGTDIAVGLWGARALLACFSLLFVIVPVLVAIFTLRAAKKAEMNQ